MLRTAICDLFGIEHPIIQGGMMLVATPELVSAVSNAGGLGIIGTGHNQPDWVRQQIHLTRERTDKPFGVNILLTSPLVKQVIEVVLVEKVAVVAFGGGNPVTYIPRFKQAGIKVMPVVSHVTGAVRLERAGADAIVADGMENRVYRNAILSLLPDVEAGNSLAVSFAKYPELFPVITSGMIGVGERTGNLDNTLKYLSKFYESEVDEATKNLSTIIEPVLLILIGIVVGTVAISILGPIYQITGNLR